MIWSRHLHIVHGNNYSIPITDGDLATSFPALRLVYAVIIILTQKASSNDTVACFQGSPLAGKPYKRCYKSAS